MKNIFFISAIFGSIIILIIFVFWQYVFLIYEVKFSITKKEINSEGRTIIIVKAVPINSFGKKALFRSAKGKFEIKSLNKNITILEEDRKRGYLKLSVKKDIDTLNIKATSNYSLYPSLLKISV